MARAGLRKKRYPKTAGGLELTPEVTDAMAEEAERGFDLSNWKREFITRPLTSDMETMGRVGFRIRNEELNRLVKQVRSEDRTVSSFIHEATMRYLESKGA